MLFLNKDDIAKTGQNIIQAAVKSAYESVINKNYNMPDRVHVADDQNMLLLMPCFSGDFFATKLVSVFPGAQEHGQPVVNGVMVLSDNVTGKPLGILDGAALTAHRTGAVGGLAVKLLTPENIDTAGIFGAGVQGLSQARFLLFNRKIKKLYLYDLNPAAAADMASVLKQEFLETESVICDDPEMLVEKSDVIIAATTSKNPLFEITAKGARGKTFISIGSFRPDMQEFPNQIIKTADAVFVDTQFAAEESGDIAIPLKNNVIGKEKIKEFALLLDEDRGEEARSLLAQGLENKTVLFKSVGMALFDLSVASAIYKLAKKNNIGQKLNF
jgi:ornithine cyclodeaminase/alanine dehydrogenase-like protein (mu-crystallin family)